MQHRAYLLAIWAIGFVALPAMAHRTSEFINQKGLDAPNGTGGTGFIYSSKQPDLIMVFPGELKHPDGGVAKGGDPKRPDPMWVLNVDHEGDLVIMSDHHIARVDPELVSKMYRAANHPKPDDDDSPVTEVRHHYRTIWPALNIEEPSEWDQWKPPQTGFMITIPHH